MKKAAMVIGCILYVLSPIDLLPDFVPFIGWVDDLAVIALTVRGLVKEEERT